MTSRRLPSLTGSAVALLVALGTPLAEFLAVWSRILSLFGESVYWLVLGPFRGTPVRWATVTSQIVDVGLTALPLTALFGSAIGLVLGIQLVSVLALADLLDPLLNGLATALSREIAPILVGILVAARSGAGVAAGLGGMSTGHEIDGLRGMGINPVRLLVAPNLMALVVCMPVLTLSMTGFMLTAFAFYMAADTSIPFAQIMIRTLEAMTPEDTLVLVLKSVSFACLIASIAAAFGLAARGGAAGVGLHVTRATVWAITSVLICNAAITYAFSG